MRKFMQHHVAPVNEVAGAVQDIIPGQDHFSALPGFAEKAAAAMAHQAAFIGLRTGNDKCSRVHHDISQFWIQVATPVELQHASLGCNRHPNFIIHGQAGCSGKLFLV